MPQTEEGATGSTAEPFDRYHPYSPDTSPFEPTLDNSFVCCPDPAPRIEGEDDVRDMGEVTQEVELPTVPRHFLLQDGDTYNGSTLSRDRSVGAHPMDPGVLRDEAGEWVPNKALLFDHLAQNFPGFRWEPREEVRADGHVRRYVHTVGWPRQGRKQLSLLQMLARCQ